MIKFRDILKEVVIPIKNLIIGASFKDEDGVEYEITSIKGRNVGAESESEFKFFDRSDFKIGSEQPVQQVKPQVATQPKMITQSQYDKKLKQAAYHTPDGTSFDVAQSLFHDQDLANYAKRKYGSQWQKHIQWDLEGFMQ